MSKSKHYKIRRQEMSYETVNCAGVIYCGHFIWEENMQKRNPLNLYNRTQFVVVDPRVEPVGAY
jgi:hypothetical protein